MSLPKFLCIVAALLFGAIGVAAWLKGGKPIERRAPVKRSITVSRSTEPVEVSLSREVRVVQTPEPQVKPPAPAVVPVVPVSPPPSKFEIEAVPEAPVSHDVPMLTPSPKADRMYQFFIRDAKQLPIVETLVYKSQVPWLKGRPAWLSDYAAHYRTSRHFIARSLHGRKNYFKQDVAEGDRFNVLRPDKNIAFYLVADIVHCKMWFYYLDLDTQERVLVKDYEIGVGRLNGETASGFLTPLGTYTLGDRIGIYKPKSKGIYDGQETQMISVFGTRWIPFDGEISGCTAPPRGFGIHGCPWIPDKVTGHLAEDTSGINEHASDGCIRMRTEDMEELFAVIISRPTTVMLVRSFAEAELPGVEAPIPTGVEK